MNKDTPILVTGAGGFIGGHIVAELLRQGYTDIRGVDIKPLKDWHVKFGDNDLVERWPEEDLKDKWNCRDVCSCREVIYHLAADMGGIGFIETKKADCMLSVLIDTHMLLAAKEEGAKRFFYSSSACCYAANKQTDTFLRPLREYEDTYPAMPEDGYGWQKLFSERMCRHFYEDYGLETRVARYHNIYGPNGDWQGGREKSIAALCRKVIESKLDEAPFIEIWGDGEQTRSFTYIDDCVKGTLMLTDSDVREPINIGRNELVSINQLVRMIEDLADYHPGHVHSLDAPKGVRGRNSDNTRILKYFDWEPSTPLKEGLKKTYEWIYADILKTREILA